MKADRRRETADRSQNDKMTLRPFGSAQGRQAQGRQYDKMTR
jgi:hypothetical protein